MTTVILQKLKQDAEKGHFHEPVSSVVLTCPASFSEQERSSLKSAAEKAGFQKVELLEEPVAAALAYGHAGFKCGDNLLVYDLGGGTFDLAVLTRDEGTFRLALKPEGIRYCGGDDFDRAMYDHFDRVARDSLQRTISGNESYVDLQFLRLCRQRKESLSDRERCEFSTYLPGGVRFKHSLERCQFERLIEDVVTKTIDLTRTVIEDAKSHGHQIQTFVLIGGASRVPLVQRLLTEYANSPVEPQLWQHQDLAVALGAAYYRHLPCERTAARGTSNRTEDLPSSLPSQGAYKPTLLELAHQAYAIFNSFKTSFAESESELRTTNRSRLCQHVIEQCEIEIKTISETLGKEQACRALSTIYSWAGETVLAEGMLRLAGPIALPANVGSKTSPFFLDESPFFVPVPLRAALWLIGRLQVPVAETLLPEILRLLKSGEILKAISVTNSNLAEIDRFSAHLHIARHYLEVGECESFAIWFSTIKLPSFRIAAYTGLVSLMFSDLQHDDD